MPRLPALLIALAASTSLAQAPDPLAAALKEPGATRTDSGLIYRVLQEGKGPSPSATDAVRVHYRGTFTDGREFDSSYSRGQPTEFPLNRVIRCWTEGVQKMKVGGKARLTCPPEIAYGPRAVGPIPPNSVLQFEIELLAVAGAPGAAPGPQGGSGEAKR